MVRLRNNINRKTRNELMEVKSEDSISLPVSLVAINFEHDGNLGFLTRAAACFGAESVVVIGKLDVNKKLRQYSANTSLGTKFLNFKTPSEFLQHAKENGSSVVSIELGDMSESIFDFKFEKDGHTYIVVGNETTGVPAEIQHNSKNVFIPMPGFGRCLNTSQAAHVALYEYVKQVL